MLKHAWQWYLYGENHVYRSILLAWFVILFSLGLICLQPAWHQFHRLEKQWLEAKTLFDNQSRLLKQDQLSSVSEPIPIPWDLLARKHDLLMKTEDKKIYFAGATDQIVELLLHVSRHYGQVFYFSIEKNNYKTLLVVDASVGIS